MCAKICKCFSSFQLASFRKSHFGFILFLSDTKDEDFDGFLDEVDDLWMRIDQMT